MFVTRTVFLALFVDKVSRRKPIVWGSLDLGISILLSFKGTDKQHATSSAAVAFFTVCLRTELSSPDQLSTDGLVDAHFRRKRQPYSMVCYP
jgi:hypothetical protein